MLYPHRSAVGPTGLLLLNLYDTPGHVDFGSEVTRSLCFVQGAVLLLDATRGIQAQTWSVHDKAKALQLPLLVAITKVDLEAARPEHVALSVAEWLNPDRNVDGGGGGDDTGLAVPGGGDDRSTGSPIDPDGIILTSARSRIGIRTLVDSICELVPAPSRLPDDHDGDGDGDSKDDGMLRVQVVDSWYDSRGVNCLVRVLSGVLSEGDRISIGNAEPRAASAATNSVPSHSVQEVGIVLPRPVRTGRLRIGYDFHRKCP
jgi:GTP-binding protein LepA